MLKKMKVNIISYIYNISKQPIKLNQLLIANQLANEGMKLEGTKLGFRLRLGRAYIVFLILAHILIIPIALLAHHFFKILDCHASILLTVFFTALLFGIFSFFKEWTRDSVAKQRIKNIWSLHFPHFPYDEYNKDIDDIYQLSVKQNIKENELERFILDKLSA
jgi:hypothetical protein